MDRTSKDQTQEAKEKTKDIQKYLWIGVGFGIAFAIFLVIGLLDKYGLLDKLLD